MWRAEPGWANKDTLKPWRDALCLTARQRWGDRDPLPSAIVEMVFVFKRPKSHRRADGSLRDGFSELHLVKPDADKLARAAMDSLTDAAVIVDDRRVVRLSAEKKYGRDPGVQIAVYRLTPDSLF